MGGIQTTPMFCQVRDESINATWKRVFFPSRKLSNVERHCHMVEDKVSGTFVQTLLSPIECPICFEIFNDTSHKPCTLECGHSMCLNHANEGLKSCPICRRSRSSDEAPVKKSIALTEAAMAIVSIVSHIVHRRDAKFLRPINSETIKHAIMCPICWLQFDEGSNIPCTIASCGHSFCLQHKDQIKSCPTCR